LSSRDLFACAIKVHDTLFTVDELNMASKDEVIFIESHCTPEFLPGDITQVTFVEVAIQVPLAVLCEEVGLRRVAIIIDRLLFILLVG
jgi:hypothetical protein